MDTKLKVKVSVPDGENLSLAQKGFAKAVCARLEAERLTVIYDRPEMNVEQRYAQIASCQGVLLLGFEQWNAKRRWGKSKGQSVTFISDFVQMDTTMALCTWRPLLVLAEKSVTLRGPLRPGFVPKPLKMPRDLQVEWLDGELFSARFQHWLTDVRRQKHVFLGYCSKANRVAAEIRSFIENIGLSVLDWHDFSLAGSLIARIEEAAMTTNCGIFLFTKDDELVGSSIAAPRDNVVFEAGYFTSAKGKGKTLIILEVGAKFPADLAGDIYLPLNNRQRTVAIQTVLRKYLEEVI